MTGEEALDAELALVREQLARVRATLARLEGQP